MASKACKGQAGKDGKLLKLLRSVGFKDELPPSTIAWLDTNPYFQWCANNLSEENFVAPGTQARYEEIQLLNTSPLHVHDRGLASAMGLSDSSSDSEDPFTSDEADSPEQLKAAIEEKKRYLEMLKAQAASLAVTSSKVDMGHNAYHSKQGSLAWGASQASAKLQAAKAKLQGAQDSLDAELQQLHAVVEQLGRLLRDQSSSWLLQAVDMEEYVRKAHLEHAQFMRGLALLSAAAGVRQLDPAGPPSPLPTSYPYQHLDAAVPGYGTSTPRGMQGSALGTPRGGLRSSNGYTTPSSKATAAAAEGPLLTPGAKVAAADALRHRDQEQCNEGLRKEMTRLRNAFSLGFFAAVKAKSELAAVLGKTAALEALLHADKGQQVKLVGQEAKLEAEVLLLLKTQMQLMTEELPSKCGELGRLQDTDTIEGDYNRQLQKMQVNNERKEVFIQHLLDTTARHLMLLSVQNQHLFQVEQLQQMLSSCRQLLSGFTSASAQRRCSYEAAAQAALQQRSNIDVGDTYLLQLLRALQPTLGAAAGELRELQAARGGPGEAQQQQEQLRSFLGFCSGRDEGGGGGGGMRTPRGNKVATTLAAAGARTPSGSPHTPRYTTVRELLLALGKLASGLHQGYSTLDSQLFHNIPQLLEGIEAAALRLHALVFPNQPARFGHGAAGEYGKQGALLRDSSSSSGTVAELMGGSGSGRVQQLHPVLTHPSLLEAMRALDRLIHEVAAAVNRLTEQQNNHLKVIAQTRREQELQRSVMTMFFTEPGKLATEVGQLQEEVEALASAPVVVRE